MSVQTLLFDLDNTLVDRDAALGRWLSSCLQTGIEQLELDLTEAMSIGASSDEDSLPLCRWLTERRPALGSAEQLAREFSHSVAEQVEPDDDVAELVRRLARRRPVGLVTNGNPSAQRTKLARAGLEDCFRCVVLADELGTPKPDPEPFRVAIRGLDTSPSRCLFVGNDPARDIAPAHALGLRTCWVSHGKPYPPGFPRPDVIVAEVRELEALL